MAEGQIITPLPNIDYKDWYANQKNKPDEDSEDYDAFYDFHKGLCKTGFIMNGIYINPFLYWHLNFWHVDIDQPDGSIAFRSPTFRDNEWIITNEIDRAHKEKKGLVILGIRRMAKALKNDELLYTEDGPIRIGEVAVGERIYDHKGLLTTVTGVFPQGKIPVYKVTFEDNREVFCCENHIWRVKDKRYNKVKDLSIKELLPIYKKPRIHNGYKDGITRNIKECFFAIPNNLPIQYEKKEVTIDPYFLGLWLGDGNSRNIAITTIDDEILEFITEYGKEWELSIRKDEICYHLTTEIRGGGVLRNKLLNEFNFYTLIKNKHIPTVYLRSSFEQRLSLLQGLMDTDGSAHKDGTLTFVTTSEKIAEGFYELCRSLGINLRKQEFVPKLYGVECGNGWKFTLFTELPIFRLKRKLSRQLIGNKGKQSKINWTTIRDIELVGEDESTCITVDNEDKLFLTTNYTVTHNSVIESSYISWGATFDENSQNVIAGLNGPDIKLITDKIDKGLNLVPKAWQWQRIEDNWKTQITLGVKTAANKRIPFSSILVRNLEDGNNQEAIAGTNPSKLIIDEIGKGSFLRGLSAAIPGFTTKYGWRCSPILTGTGGDMLKFMDAKKLMFDVKALNFLHYNSAADERRVHGLFLPNKYRIEGKVLSTFGNYLDSPEDSPLHNIPMEISDEEKSARELESRLTAAKISGDRTVYLKEKMYYPVEVDDIFLNESTNIFKIEACKRVRNRLQVHPKDLWAVDLFLDGGTVKWKASKKLPLTEFPHKPSDNKDTPIQIYEHPVKDAPFGLYIAGVDSYRSGNSASSDSLGAVYIYKRMHSIIGEEFQDCFVASYVGRPEDKDVWEDQARLLCKYYNARVAVENNEMSFIEYMKAKGDAHMLVRFSDFTFIREILPNTTVKAEFGINRTSPKIIKYLHSTYKKYQETPVFRQVDENGSVIIEILGVEKIPDPMLLEETIQYNEDDNFDRIIAAEIAIAYANILDPIIGKSAGEEDDRIKSLFKKTTKGSRLFQSSHVPFKKSKRKLFQ